MSDDSPCVLQQFEAIRAAMSDDSQHLLHGTKELPGARWRWAGEDLGRVRAHMDCRPT